MNEATLAQTVMSLVLMLIFLGFLIWGIRTGQFKGTEEAKYRMFEEHEMEEAFERGEIEREDG